MGLARQHRMLFAAAALLLGSSGAVAAAVDDRPASVCATPGTWIDPADRAVLDHRQLLADLAARPVVLLGERHDSAEHHRWQLHTVAALHGHRPDMALGFEAFPRRLQPVLNRWVAGELSEDAFIEAAEWSTVWGFDAALYLPLFHFARQNGVPMLALNVERSLIARIGREGIEAVPVDEREGVSHPSPPAAAYRRSLAQVFAHKRHLPGDASGALNDPAFQRFVEAQSTWDRAMAQAIAEARKAQPDRLVVAILGRGHVEHRWGVPHQLADLEIADAAVLLPVERSDECAGVPPDVADAVFVVHPDAAPGPRGPRLGVMIESADGGARVTKVMSGGVAEATGIETDDVIVEAAGVPVRGGGDLIATVKRQAPGTWLPLRIRRGGDSIERVARFPPAADTP